MSTQSTNMRIINPPPTWMIRRTSRTTYWYSSAALVASRLPSRVLTRPPSAPFARERSRERDWSALALATSLELGGSGFLLGRQRPGRSRGGCCRCGDRPLPGPLSRSSLAWARGAARSLRHRGSEASIGCSGPSRDRHGNGRAAEGRG
jgi:hypothetical protein